MTNTAKTKTLKSILDYINSGAQRRTVVNRLNEHDSFVLRTILQGNYSDKISFTFPTGAPPFERNEEAIDITDALLKPLGKITKNAPGLQIVKEGLLIEILESVSAEDADIIVAMKDGDLETLYPKITKAAVELAFPELLK